MKKIVLTFSLAVMAMMAWAQNGRVVIASVNDMHAQIEQMPKFAFVMDSLRNIYPDLLLLSAGDNRTGNAINDQYSEPSWPMTCLMNYVGFNASTLGNHEFDGGMNNLALQVSKSNFRYLCANFVAPDTMRVLTMPNKFFQVGDVKVGILGLVQRGALGIPDCHPDRVKGVTFLPELDAVKENSWMRERCNLFLLLTHMGFEEDVAFTKEVAPYGVDAIIGGHSHTRVEHPTAHNGIVVTQSENKLKYVTLSIFDIKDGKMVGYEGKLISIKNASGSDPKVEQMVKEFSSNPALTRVLTQVAEPFTNTEQLGSMMADSYRKALGADIAFQNRGGVRFETKDRGPFTVYDAYQLDPFGNEAVTVNMTGQQIKDMIVGCLHADGYGAPCCSGIKYEIAYDSYDINDRAKAKITKITMEDGSKFDLKKTYKVATSTFVMSTSVPSDADQGTNTYTPCSDYLLKFLESTPSLDYSKVKRVTEKVKRPE